MTTTTTAAREAAKNLAIYNAIAEHARRAFEALEILPGQYTPAQVVNLLKKSRARWDDDADRREVARVEVEGFACSFLLADVFAVLAQVATAYEIPTRNRVTFVRAAETAPAAVSFTITKTAAAEVAKAVAKKDPDRAAMEFAYIDTDRRALVGANGHVLTVAPLSSLSVAEDARPGYLVARCLLKADRVTIDTNNNATDGARVAESPDWLRFPAWSSVFPAVYDTDALTIDAKTRRELAKAVAAATKFAGEELNGCRLVSIFGEGYTSKIVVRSRREVAAPTADDPTATRCDVHDAFVQLPAELSRSFALTFHGPDFATLPAFEKMYITPNESRPAVFAGSHAVALLIPQLLPDTAERVCCTDSRPTWAKAVDPLADLLAAAPAANSIETPAAPAADLTAESEAETIETPAAPAADSIETPAAPAADSIETADDYDSQRAARDARRLLLIITRHALRLAAAAALLLLLTIAPDRTADTLAAPADLTATPAPAADSIEAESRAELAAPADSPRTAAERRHARDNKRESRARDLLTVATADSIAAPLLLTADSIEADTLAAEVATLETPQEITAPADTLAAGSTLEPAQEITDAPTDDTDSEAGTITTDDAPTDDTDSEAGTITTDDAPTDDTTAAADSESDTAHTGTATSGHPHAHGSTPATMAAPCSPSAPLAPVAPILI